MKTLARYSIVILLECIALGIGAYTYSFLHYTERLHVFIETAALCCGAAIIGFAVILPKIRTLAAYSAILVSLIPLGIGYYFLSALHYHERAAITLGIGTICLIGGISGRLRAHSMTALFTGYIVLGLIAMAIGTYFRFVQDYHGRAYFALGTGAICLSVGLIALVISYIRSGTQPTRI